MNTYKKRAKGSWHQGKGYKGDSEERMHAKKEIQESVKIDLEEGLTRHKGKRKRNKKASLEHMISWYTQKIEEYERNGHSSSHTHYLRDGLRKARREYEEKYGDEKPK
jgi:outer membrane receptor for ferrienterochelin and colicin